MPSQRPLTNPSPLPLFLWERVGRTGLIVFLLGISLGAAASSPESSEKPEATLLLLRSLQPDPKGLTADQVANEVLRASPDLQARKQEVSAAAAAVDQAQIAFFPKLVLSGTLGVASRIQPNSLGALVVAPQSPLGPLAPGAPLVNAPISLPQTPAHRYALQASLTIPLSDYLLRTRQALSGARNNEAAAEVDHRASALTVGLDARVLYYNWVRAKLQVAVAEQNLRQSQDHLRDVRNALEAGQASRADVLSSESQEARSELLLEKTRDLAAFSEQQLRIVMHDSGHEPFRVAENALNSSPAPASDNVDALQREALEARLEPVALDRTSESLKEQAKVANAGTLPRLDGIASVQYANPNPNVLPLQDTFTTTWLVGLQATWEVNGLGDAAAARRGLEAKAAAAQARRVATQDAVRTEVAQAYQALQDARAAVQSSARSLASSEEAYRVRRELFQNGHASNVELTDAETDLTSSRFSVVDAQIDRRIASLRLTHATGRDRQ